MSNPFLKTWYRHRAIISYVHQFSLALLISDETNEFFITDQMYKIYWNENRDMRVHEYCRVNLSTTPLLVIKKTTRMCIEAILSLILRVLRLPNFLFYQKRIDGNIRTFFVKGVQITSTLITKYHTPLYLTPFFIQFYFLV